MAGRPNAMSQLVPAISCPFLMGAPTARGLHKAGHDGASRANGANLGLTVLGTALICRCL